MFAHKWSGPELPWLFGYTLSWTLVYLLGAAYILMRGMRSDANEYAACMWPRGKLALSFVTFLILYCCVLLILDNSTRIKLAVIRSDAVSVALALQPPRVADHLNAAHIYEKAFEAMEKDLPDWWDELGEPSFDLSQNGVKESLQEKGGAIALLLRASTMPEYHVEVNYLKGDIPKLFPYKNAASLLSLDARFKAANGETDAGLKSAAAIRGMADHLRAIPSILANMMSAAIQQMGTRTAENILSHGPLILAGVVGKPLDNTVHFQEAFNRALRMDEALMAFTSTSYLTVSSVSQWFPLGELLYRAVFLYDEMTSARTIMLEAHTIAAKPYWKAFDDWKRWDDKAKAFRGLITAIAIPSYGRGTRIKILEAEAGEGLTNLAFAASAYQADHGNYPESIEALAPQYIAAIPADPFSGKPLKLASVEGGLILYSVGPDLKDERGAKEYDSKLESSKLKTGDITFVMGSAFEDLRLQPSREWLQKRAKERAQRPKKRKR